MTKGVVNNVKSDITKETWTTRFSSLHGVHRDARDGWLNHGEDEELEVILRDEAVLFQAFERKLGELQQPLIKAMRARDGSDDESLAVQMGRYVYFERWARGDDHVVYCRRPAEKTEDFKQPNAVRTDVELLLDANALARNRSYFELGDIGVSPDGRMLAWTTDTTGDERYRIFVKSIETGELVTASDPIADSDFEWADTDPPSIVYAHVDEDERVSSIRRHRLDAIDFSNDEVLFVEDDEAWSTGVYKSRCGRMLFIQTDSFDGNEIYTLAANLHDSEPVLFCPRKPGTEWYPELDGDRYLVMRSDTEHPEFRMFEVPVDSTDSKNFSLVLTPPEGHQLELVEAYADFYLVAYRCGASVFLDLYDRSHKQIRRVHPAQSPGEVSSHDNPMHETSVCRLSHTSAVDGEKIVSIDPFGQGETLLWEENPGDSYRPEDYGVARTYATAHDGQLIPITLVWRRDRRRAGGNPVWLHVYGAYDDIVDISLDTDRLGILDSGIVWAVAHVRGGGERGRSWYEGGRLARKSNSVSDYLNCVEFLERSGWLLPGACIAHGESAGGLVVGAAASASPASFAGVIAEVPFVDVMNSLLDEELPNTLADREEFGDPHDVDQFARLLAISAVDNVSRLPWPPVLATTGLSDPRVPVWEAIKWVWQIRARSTSDAPALLLPDLDGGHHGPSGRAGEIHHLATLQAFARWCIERRQNG